MSCPHCGASLLPNSPACLECGRELPRETIKKHDKEREAGRVRHMNDMSDVLKLALFSTIYPGLAHIVYLGSFLRGAALAGGFSLSLYLAHAFCGSFYVDYPAIVAGVTAYFWSFHDAVRIYRQKYNIVLDGESRHGLTTVAIFCFLAMCTIYYSIAAYYERNVRDVMILTQAIEPFFVAGDRILIDIIDGGTPLSRGEIVRFTPAGRPEEMQGGIIYRGEGTVERIIGLPGETITCDGKDIFANGKKLDRKFHPMFARGLVNFPKNPDGLVMGKNEYLLMLNVAAGRYAEVMNRFIRVGRQHITGKVRGIAYPFHRRMQF